MSKNEDQEAQASLPAQILSYLIQQYGSRIGVDSSNFVDICVERNLLSSRGAENLLNGETQKLTSKSRNAIMAIFEPAIRNLKTHWLKANSLQDLINKIERPMQSGNGEAMLELYLVRGADARNEKLTNELSNELVGYNFISYRYAFENTGRIAKELLSIYDSGGGDIRFKYYFRVGPDSVKTFRVCSGGLIAVSTSIVLVGVYTDIENQKSRIRTLMLLSEDHDDKQPVNHFNQRVGMMMSGLPSTNRLRDEPGTSIVFLERLETMGLLSEDVVMNHINWIEAEDIEKENWHPNAKIITDLISNQPTDFIVHADNATVNKKFENL